MYTIELFIVKKHIYKIYSKTLRSGIPQNASTLYMHNFFWSRFGEREKCITSQPPNIHSCFFPQSSLKCIKSQLSFFYELVFSNKFYRFWLIIFLEIYFYVIFLLLENYLIILYVLQFIWTIFNRKFLGVKKLKVLHGSFFRFKSHRSTRFSMDKFWYHFIFTQYFWSIFGFQMPCTCL